MTLSKSLEGQENFLDIRPVLSMPQVACGIELLQSQLTDREIEVFCLWLSGHSIKESSRILHIALRTIEEHRARIKEKLMVRDKISLYNIVGNFGIFEFVLRISKMLKERKTQ